jgi:hypothetical protein
MYNVEYLELIAKEIGRIRFFGEIGIVMLYRY